MTAAQNATTHGLFARDVVLPALGEDPAAFDALLQQLCDQLPPRNLLERHYLEQIAAASWRLRRLHRWQAQAYEDDTLTEDQRLDRLDRVLRHETALTRQIDRAVRTLNRDLSWLFQTRARDEALYHRDLTEAEVRAEPELGIEVQREVWRRLRPAPDNAAPTLPAQQNCQNENYQNEPPTHATRAGQSPDPPTVGEPCERGTSEQGGGSPPPPVHEKCENEKCENEPAPKRPPSKTLRDLGQPGAYIAYRKREQELYNRCHPDRPDTTDWDAEEVRQAYATAT